MFVPSLLLHCSLSLPPSLSLSLALCTALSLHLLSFSLFLPMALLPLPAPSCHMVTHSASSCPRFSRLSLLLFLSPLLSPPSLPRDGSARPPRRRAPSCARHAHCTRHAGVAARAGPETAKFSALPSPPPALFRFLCVSVRSVLSHVRPTDGLLQRLPLLFFITAVAAASSSRKATVSVVPLALPFSTLPSPFPRPCPAASLYHCSIVLSFSPFFRISISLSLSLSLSPSLPPRRRRVCSLPSVSCFRSHSAARLPSARPSLSTATRPRTTPTRPSSSQRRA